MAIYKYIGIYNEHHISNSLNQEKVFDRHKDEFYQDCNAAWGHSVISYLFYFIVCVVYQSKITQQIKYKCSNC